MKKSVFIGMPIYGAVDPNFFKCAMKLCAEFSQNTSILPWHGDSLIPRARNAISARFLQTDCTHLLMLDSDLLFSTEHISRLMSHNVDVVGGFYPKKSEGSPQLVWNPTVPASIERPDGLVRANYMGSGFLMACREVFERMASEFRDEIEYHPDNEPKTTEWDFWSVGVYRYPDGTRRYLSEDWFFCQRCLDLGFEVWGDTRVALKHSGGAIYPLQTQENSFFRKQEMELCPT